MKKKGVIWTFVFLILILPVVYSQEETTPTQEIIRPPEETEQSAFGEPIEDPQYTVFRDKIDRTIQLRTFFRDGVEIYNKKLTPISLSFAFSGDTAKYITLESDNINIEPNSRGTAYFQIIGRKEGVYQGQLTITGSINEEMPVRINVVTEELTSPFLIQVSPEKSKFTTDQKIKFKVDIQRLLIRDYELNINYRLQHASEQNFTELGSESLNITNSLSLLREYDVPENIPLGTYVLTALVSDLNITSTSTAIFEIDIPFYKIKLFGFLPVWILGLIIAIVAIGTWAYLFIKKQIEANKKYKVEMDLNTLTPKGQETLFFGKVAELNNEFHFDMNQFLTHCIVAGATGGGKSISAQDIIEEALLKNVAVVVFDPTAQWSGMLRKCKDKKMFAYYPKFGFKEKDAKAFNGNIRAVRHALEYIDLNKYIKPGEIQIYTLNKLDPKDMDIFVANMIVQIFRSSPKEARELKLMLVFDEVHRLLTRFGGSGAGFTQIERACREFRKWGMGVILVSQVLSDFMGEIKANINTEIQMRTRDEGDLSRIQTKYGDEILQSLVKASVGVGMVVNTIYNHGKPMFIQFRPILHSVHRLTDEELDQYNKYNDIIDELEWQIDQLEQEKLDVFDMRLELKLSLDKVKSGNFNMVDIYLEGLKPRLEQQWNKIGKKPKKRPMKLVEEDTLKAAIEKAKKEKAKAGKEGGAESEEGGADVMTKKVEEFTFASGLKVSTLKEFKETAETIDEELFKKHVDDKKNDFADWAKKSFSKNKEIAEAFSKIKTKKDLVEVLKSLKPKKAEEKKAEEKKEAPKEEKSAETKEEAKPTDDKSEEKPDVEKEKSTEDKKEEPKVEAPTVAEVKKVAEEKKAETEPTKEKVEEKLAEVKEDVKPAEDKTEEKKVEEKKEESKVEEKPVEEKKDG